MRAVSRTAKKQSSSGNHRGGAQRRRREGSKELRSFEYSPDERAVLDVDGIPKTRDDAEVNGIWNEM
jgi:hypothetical protein